jgi:hypothetical protein
MIATGSAFQPALVPIRNPGRKLGKALGWRTVAVLGALCLAWAGGCGGEHSLVVTVLGVDPGVRLLRVHSYLDDHPLREPQELAASVGSFTIPLAAGVTGRVGFRIEGLAPDTCVTAEGRAATFLPAEGTVALDVFMAPRGAVACPVMVNTVGGGDGTVLSSGGEIECGPRCVVELDRGTALHLSVSLGGRGHFVGWSGACQGTASCDLTVTGPTAVQANLVPAAVCSPGEFCWQSPLPQGHTIRALWATSASDQWAVGDQGLILHWDGRSWAGLPSGLSFGLHALWGQSANDVWAVGENGSVLHYTGTFWQRLSTGTDRWLRAIWGTSSHDLWAVGDEGTILHFDGARWTAPGPSISASLYAVWGTAKNDVWAVGYGGTAWHFDGTDWQAVTIGTNLLVSALWGSGPKDVWAVGHDFTANAGAIWHYKDAPV